LFHGGEALVDVIGKIDHTDGKDGVTGKADVKKAIASNGGSVHRAFPVLNLDL